MKKVPKQVVKKNETIQSVKKPVTRSKQSAMTSEPLSQSKSDNNPTQLSKAKTALTGVKKEYLKTAKCKVTFCLPKEAAPDAAKVTLVGDFNNWNYTQTEMKKMKSGDFKLSMELPCNREYRFRYLIDSRKWENDWCADKYAPNPFGGDDSIVVI